MLKAIVDTLEEIPEALRSHYVETPHATEKDKLVFSLDLDDGIRNHPKMRPLVVAFDRQKQEIKDKGLALAAANEKLALLPADFDIDAYHALLEDSQGKGRKIDERIQAVRADEAKKAEAQMAPLRDRVAVLETAMKKKAAREALNEALSHASIAPEFQEAAAALILSKYSVKTEEDKPGEFTVMIDSEVGGTDPKSFVKDWAGGDEGKPFVNKAKGGGANGAGAGGGQPGENPWAKAEWNMTKQQAIIRQNPVRARDLAQRAGVKATW